ncbi:RNA polymerase sigma factor [Bacillus phage vB_BmeM-Goe8]|uniref:RNA polymerase sigma factor n=1 Tax=Bacillus phage vB_BmeM-Goe8 TaxID=2593638 RepID=A0A516KMW6_9CAUD|nr:RNA polymerase sigma factor [Bacillus phage vB_BmeM-Goe8]QDP42942.1 RNA polymerase sigma factor [Bacillus phage vB_BmeM-Goe8]
MSKYKVRLNEQETLAMIEKAQAGDKDAANVLFRANEGIIWTIIQPSIGKGGKSKEDIFQVACIGFLKAVYNYNPEIAKFGTFLNIKIGGELRRYFRDNQSVIHVPRTIKELGAKILMHQLRDEPVEVIKEKLGVTNDKLLVDTLNYINRGTAHVTSLYTVVIEGQGEDLTLEDQLAGDLNGDDWEDNLVLLTSVKEAINCLAEREQVVIRKRYIEGKSQVEVAKGLGISQMQISRIERKALLKLKTIITQELSTKEPITEEMLPGYKPRKAPKAQESRGDRAEAIRLIQETELTFAEISRITGVPKTSVSDLNRRMLKKAVAK